MKNNLLEYREIAREAALEASKYLSNNKQDDLVITSNTKKDIKINADIESENIIKEIISKHSQIPILGEETGMSSDDTPSTFWVIDPLDGTINYLKNIPLSCVAIGLIDKNRPVLGTIIDLANNNIYEGSIDDEATLNNKKISVSSSCSIEESILMTGLPSKTDFSDEAIVKMVKDFQKWKKVRMIGSAALASAYVSSGKIDCYKESGTNLWDVAAGAAIVNAAGGKAEIISINDDYKVDVIFSNNKLSL
jgi:myo-inositol-1(or 4)-monophosphatase